HMLFQSANFPAIMFKGWSPISFGAWAILVFGFFSVLSALGGMAEEGRLQNPALRAVGGAVRGGSGLAKVVGGVAGLPGLFLAPLRLHLQRRPVASAAKLVLLGGFLLRLATIFASEGVDRYRVAAGM